MARCCTSTASIFFTAAAGPLHRLELPFRVIWGRQDPIAVYDIALRLQARNPNLELVTLDDIGHYPQLEAPQRVAAAIGLV